MDERRIRDLILECLALYGGTTQINVDRAHIRVGPLAHGWYTAIRRTSRAILLLTEAGFEIEAAPLRRSLIEHVVALSWLVRAEDSVVTSVLRAYQHTMSDLQLAARNAASDVSDDSAFDMILGIDPGSSPEDQYMNFTQRCNEFGSPQLLFGWKLESNLSHPSFSTSAAYVHEEDEADAPTLLHEPRKDFDSTLSIVLSCVLQASNRMNRIITDQPWTHTIERIATELHASMPSSSRGKSSAS